MGWIKMSSQFHVQTDFTTLFTYDRKLAGTNNLSGYGSNKERSSPRNIVIAASDFTD
jgi:hypothetical protein